MPAVEVFFGLLVAVVFLTWLAQKLNVAYTILLVIGGLLISFIPGLPRIEMRPEIVFLLFLPPLLYYEAVTSSLRDIRANLRPILLLAIGLVLVTVAVVAAVAHYFIPGFAWATAIVLGAIVAPTDETAVAAIAERLNVPHRQLTIIEGESLFNDATSLVIYRVALTAVVSGTFAWAFGLLHLLIDAVAGIAVGIAVGWLVLAIRSRLDNPPLENTISLMSGFAAYFPADALGFSGVFAVVACGLYVGRQSARAIGAHTRLQNREMREVALFVINGLLYILLGLQLHATITGLAGAFRFGRLLEYALLVSLTAIAVRIAWIFPAVYLPRFWSRARRKDPPPPWQLPALVSWAGMRGGISLAAALAVPLTLASGKPFPDRGLILFLTFAVILTTLVVQGLTLPRLIQWLRLKPDLTPAREERLARIEAARAALRRLAELAKEAWVEPSAVEDLRRHYRRTADHYREQRDDGEASVDHLHADAYRRLRTELINAQRDAIVDLRDRDIINDQTLNKVGGELDLDEVRYGEEPPGPP